MLQGTCLQLLKNLQSLAADFYCLVLQIRFLTAPQVRKGPVVRAHLCPPPGAPSGTWLHPWKKNTGLLLGTHPAAAFSLKEKGHTQVERQSPGSLSSQKKKMF